MRELGALPHDLQQSLRRASDLSEPSRRYGA
jgi:hypothetical protein